jgi:hypothetical protein
MKNKNGYVGIIILVLVSMFGLAVLGSAMNLITIPWLKFDSKVQMNRDIVTKTYNADNALYNYHWFQERAGAIKANKSQIIVADQALKDFQESAGPRKDWTFEDKTEESRLRSVSQGLKSQLQSIVEEYNAKAGEADRSIFTDDLPLFFNLN